MSNDPGEKLHAQPRPDFTMPKLLDVQMRAIRFEPPKHRNFVSALPRGDGVEFIIKTEGPIPVCARGPALYVGETIVIEVTEIGPNTYRFVAPTKEGLELDAPIRLCWSGELYPDVKGVAFRYRA